MFRAAFLAVVAPVAAMLTVALAVAPLRGQAPQTHPPFQPRTRLGISGDAFTINGRPTFLLGVSYYGGLAASEDALVEDLTDLRPLGFNWLRVWATWAAFEHDASAVDEEGMPRAAGMESLRRLVELCDRHGFVVDVTLSRGNGVTGPSRLATLEAHRRAVEAIARELDGLENWYLDLANERNIGDARFVSIEELRVLRDAFKAAAPQRLVTASHGGDLGPGDAADYLAAGLDFLAPHRPRGAGSPSQTAEHAREVRRWLADAGTVAPIHFQEPFRRGYSRDWEPDAQAYLDDLAGALSGGAAGWCLHNGDQRDADDGRPRRSFDLRDGRLLAQLDAAELDALRRIGRIDVQAAFAAAGAGDDPWVPRTRVAIDHGRWHINGQPTCRGAAAEGLLLNVRMVNAVFEDAGRDDFDPQANTDEFLAALPDYIAHGVRAFTLCLQGGMPGYEGAVNSAFAADGSLDEAYLRRVERVVRACDRQGAAVILGCYYQRQDQRLRDEAAVRAGVSNVARWVAEQGFSNVLLEIANEFPHGGFDHPLLRDPEGQAELIQLARQAAPGLLVSTSDIGDGLLSQPVARESDFLLVHFNGVPVDEIAGRIAALRHWGKPIVCNEDDKVGAEAARAAEESVRHGASWGLMLLDVNQTYPFAFGGAADDETVYARLRELAAPP